MILIPEKNIRINDKFIESDNISTNIQSKLPVTHKLINGQPNSNEYRYQAEFYKYFALDIVTETVFNYPYPYVSEKTLRPFACKRMLIVVGAAGTLELLHSKGFITFSDIIDESYDIEQDPEKRFILVTNAIRDFLNLDLLCIKKYFRNNKEIFEHNFDVLTSIRQTELKELDKFLNKIHDQH